MQQYSLPEYDFGFEPRPADDATDDERAHAQRRTVEVFRTMPTQRKMRMLSDAALASSLDWHLEDGFSYHMITGGEVDGMSVLAHVLRSQRAEYLLVATWCMGRADLAQLSELVKAGTIGRIDIYTGEVFKASRHAQPSEMRALADSTGGRLVRMLNHSKVCLVYGERQDVCIESSANLNTNPRCENTVITVDSALCDFWKGWFDSQPPEADGDYPDWAPWSRCAR